MTKYTVKEVNVETGEEIERLATTTEAAQIKADVEESKAEQDAIAAKNAIRDAVLEKLGLTAEEAAAILT